MTKQKNNRSLEVTFLFEKAADWNLKDYKFGIKSMAVNSRLQCVKFNGMKNRECRKVRSWRDSLCESHGCAWWW